MFAFERTIYCMYMVIIINITAVMIIKMELFNRNYFTMQL